MSSTDSSLVAHVARPIVACVHQGQELDLILIGSGRCRAGLEARAAALGLGERVRFCDQLPSGEAVREQLDQADLFVLPSRAEGAPRAMIEAMARGLPCIGSTVGGVPELLAPDDLVPPGDVRVLAGKIRKVLSDSECLARMSKRNLEKAREYRQEILRQRRDEFYRYLLRRTERWQRARGFAAQGGAVGSESRILAAAGAGQSIPRSWQRHCRWSVAGGYHGQLLLGHDAR